LKEGDWGMFKKKNSKPDLARYENWNVWCVCSQL